jgi:formiminoglutamase
LFDGQLPDLNLGTASGTSCAAPLQNAIAHVIKNCEYSAVINGRFSGGYITRHYGEPDNNIHAVQMEIAQCTYMKESKNASYNEKDADKLKQVLRRVFASILNQH